MKNRDAVLFGVPLVAALLLVGIAVFLYDQVSDFEEAYLAEARENVEQEANLVSATLSPLLDAGKTDESVRLCESFDRNTLRVTLIDSAGKVLADSAEPSDILPNHTDREEVKSALAGTPSGVVRYSSSLGETMIYYAVPLRSQTGDYVLRVAVSAGKVSRTLGAFRLNLFCALLYGGVLVLLLASYMIRRIRKPLVALQKSVAQIAEGKLETPIAIPEKGMVGELAAGISAMADQLRGQLAEVTAERNERRLLFDTMSEAVLLFASNGDLVRANRAAAEIFGFPADSKRFNLGRCQMPELLDCAKRAFKDDEPFEREFVLEGGSGARSLFIRGRILKETERRMLLLTVTELTNLRRLESFRTDFVANVSHEIKTPLTCILGAVEALEDDPPQDMRKKLLGMLKNQAPRLNNLVQDILSLADLEKRQRGPERDFTEVALDSLLVNAVNISAQLASDAGLALRAGNLVPLKIAGDSILLEQAVGNLIDNAIKYSGGTKIDVSLHEEGAFAVVEVLDDGVGIPPEHRKRIFERFYRVDKSRSRELGGTGLGLAIVKHIAQLHGGKAELESGPDGRGCLFRLVLPLAS